MRNVLLVGGGYVASALTDLLLASGANVSIIKRYPCEVAAGVNLILGDITKPLSLSLHEPLDALVYSISPDEHTEEAYQLAYVDGINCTLSLLRKTSALNGPVLFTSSTGVYGQNQGEWVDEDSTTSPEDFSGNIILEGETILRESEFSSLIVRFGGIYGPGREKLIEDVRQGTAKLSPTPQYSNRIHRDDCAGILFHLLESGTKEGTFLAVDSEPADRNEVLSWLADQLGCAPPSVSLTPNARGMGKRCSNKRIREAGYTFKFSNFREGYRSLLAEV